ncbi:interleukin-23 receptor isoform X2 [Phyllobates terribilis]|uniref:interleukin-23 receptor isoform X2 n=1 Tax=Phyllobates terribilis TaxID=111132 RepID=UPI003CCA9C44
MEIKFTKWNVIWIFQVFTIKLSEGLVSINGDLIFKPASLVSVGANLTIICINKLKTCSGFSTFKFEVNEVMRSPDWQNHTASMIQLLHIREAYPVVCYIECHRFLHVINMKQLQVGYPPDRPMNVQCRVEEFSTEMKCEWDKGQITGLPTHYEVHLKNLQTGEDVAVSTTEAVVTFPMNMTQNVTHQIQIFAVNQLNQSKSETENFHLADIVVPLTPMIRKMNYSETSLIIYIEWRNQTSENQRYCAVEYKTLKEPNWTLAGEELNINNVILLKKIRNADSLRVRCREKFGKSFWSKWSAPHMIPPSPPGEIPNVWRLLGQRHPDGTQEVTILIAPDPDDPPRINVSSYEVYYDNKGVRTSLKRCFPFGVKCDALIPKGVQMVFTMALNPYGFSPAADLPLQEEDGNGPQNVTVGSLHSSSLLVRWQPPASSVEPIRWYVVQWTSDSCDGKHRKVSWKKTGKEQRNFTIQEDVAPGQRIGISLYAVYSTGVRRAGTLYGRSQELEPKTGPSSIKIISPSSKARIIEWSEIAQCDRRGLITGYTLHIKQFPNETNFIHEVPESTRHLLFDKFNPDKQYSVCISASTRAGKGPEHCTNFHQDNDFTSYVGLLVGMACGVMVLATIILTLSGMQERVKKVLTKLLPECLHKEYPDVRKSSAVKSLQESKESLIPPHSLLPSDPDIVEIEEMPVVLTCRPIPSANPAQETNNINDVEESPLIPTAEIEVPEHTLGYRPQITNVTCQRRGSYCGPAHMLERQSSFLESGSPGVQSNDTPLLNIADDIFKGLNLTVTMDINLHDDALQSMSNPTLQSLWENQTFIDKLLMSDVPSDQEICPPSLPEEFDNTKFYFPQIFTSGL